jgi:hypothetical protein
MKAVRMVLMEASNPRPLRQIRRPLNKQKVSFEGTPGKGILFCYVRSRNVYENNGNVDKLAGEKAEISRNWTLFLPKLAGIGEQFVENSAFVA